MLIVLPPSETKALGGSGPPLDLDELSFPELSRLRDKTARKLLALSKKPRVARATLGVSARQQHEITANLELREAPTMPAIERYTGVLYDALDVETMTAGERSRADARVAICSALFGLVRAADHIPAYRLSAGTKLFPGTSLAHLWRSKLGPVLEEVAGSELVVDLRSQPYMALAPVASAVIVGVYSEHPDGTRTIVSHANKFTKGQLARVLASSSGQPRSAAELREVAEAAGFKAELREERFLDIIVPA